MESTIIAALIALGGIILSVLGSTVGTYFINKKLNKANGEVQKEIANRNIDANLIARARQKWIEEVRKLTTELISNVSMTNLNGSKVIHSNKKLDGKKEFLKPIDSEFNDIEEFAIYQPAEAHEYQNLLLKKIEDQQTFTENQFKVFAIAENLILYFSPQEEHNHIIDNIEWFKKSQELFNNKIKDKNYKEAEDILNEFSFQISAFKNNMRIYLKKEWDKSKQAK